MEKTNNNILFVIITVLLCILTSQPGLAQEAGEEMTLRDITSKISAKTDVQKNEQLYQLMLEKFPRDSTNHFDYVGASSNLAASWLREKNMEKYRHYAQIVYDHAQSPRDKYLLVVFVNQVLSSWAEKGENLSLARQVALERFNEISRPVEGSDSSGQMDFGKVNYAKSAFTYALVLYKSGDLDEALKYAQEASSQLLTDDSLEFVNFYATILGANGYHEKGMELLESRIKKGNYNEATLTQLKKLYIDINDDREGFESYRESLEQVAYQTAYEEVLKKRLEKPIPAPGFALMDLNGNVVSLDQFKDKIVIIDFWATWCVPCIKSFPGLEVAMEEYENDSEVKFLYIDTRESYYTEPLDSLSLKNRVQKFITENEYPFHVLLDADNKIYKQYEIQGLPTRIVVDKQGLIQFKTAGFPGSDAKVFNEAKAMIEIIKKEG